MYTTSTAYVRVPTSVTVSFSKFVRIGSGIEETSVQTLLTLPTVQCACQMRVTKMIVNDTFYIRVCKSSTH